VEYHVTNVSAISGSILLLLLPGLVLGCELPAPVKIVYFFESLCQDLIHKEIKIEFDLLT
jgi:hypothetical protein